MRDGPNLAALIVGISGLATIGLLTVGAAALALRIAVWTQEMRDCGDDPEVCILEVMP